VTIVRGVGRKIARLITLLIEVLGFEVVKVKPSGTRRASIRLIKPTPAANRPTPARYVSGSVDANRYFTVNVSCEAGINHLKSALALLVKESLSLHRTPVVFTPRFLPSHNFGKAVDASWDRYIDLDRIAVLRNGPTDYVKAVKRDVAADHEEALAVLEVKGKHFVTPAENAEYQLIIKNSGSGLGTDAVYSHDEFDFDVDFFPSGALASHADHIRRQLGVYHSMHVRRGDKLKDKKRYPNLERDTQPAHIYDTVSRVVPKGSRVYILTDEKAPNYFDVLKKDYEVFQYVDFPELKALVDGDHPDNFFLFEIEQLIFATAATKIHTFAHPGDKSRISLTTDTIGA
jgi:hypothetical protein